VIPVAHIRIGLIGAGLLGLTHAVSLFMLKGAGLGDVELVSVYDPEHAAAESLVKNLGFKRAVASPEEIIADETIDTVYVATPTLFHHDYLVAAAKAGKNVFCEKPLSVSFEGARSMADAVKQAGVVGGVGLVLRYSPTYRFIRKKIENGDWGIPIIVTLRNDQCFPIRGLHQTAWRADRRIAGGGTLIEHSIHDLDLFEWLFGRPRIVDVSVRYLFGREGIEDYARIGMGFTSGMEGVLSSIWHDMVTRVSNRRLEVIFERLLIATDHDAFGPVEYTEGDDATVIVEADRVLSAFLEEMGLPVEFFKNLDYTTIGPYVVENYFFLVAVAEKKAYEPGFPDAVRAHEVVDEIYRRAGR
jgi:predicted dehydrogenase